MKTLVKSLRCVAPDARRSFFASVAVIGGSLSFLSLPAAAVNLRQIPNLPSIPPSITFPAERDVLKTDLDRLAERRDALGISRTAYDRECMRRLPHNHVSRRHCSHQLQELRRDSSRLRTDIIALRQRFQTVEDNARRQRGNGPLSRRMMENSAATGRPDARLKLIRQALVEYIGGWPSVLAYIKAEIGTGAGNPAMRDAFAYLNGMYEGQIAADRLDNVYYRHGVRRWLARDHWTAALSFARAARDNPDDHRVFASFADAAGRQHASPACQKARRCVSGNISNWAKRFGRPHALAVKNMLARTRKVELSTDVVSLRNMLGAIVVFSEKSDSGAIGDRSIGDSATVVLSKAQGHNFTVALKGYIELWRRLEEARMSGRPNLFFERYANASGDRTARAFLNETGEPSVDAAADEGYLKHLRDSLVEGSGNPFSGRLTQAQIIRLQR